MEVDVQAVRYAIIQPLVGLDCGPEDQGTTEARPEVTLAPPMAGSHRDLESDLATG